MNKNIKLIKNLNKLFTSTKFISSLMQGEDEFSNYVYYKMGRILEYYITTRDENVNYTYEEIEEKLSQIDYEELRENIIDEGFLTHSFNGNKKAKIEKYGLDYAFKMHKEEMEQHNENRELLNELEQILGTSTFVKYLERNENNTYNQSTFVCTPGAKTFHYACRRSPERLYEGPLKGYKKEPIIVGETKENFLMRVLQKKINEKYPQNASKEKEYAIDIAKKVIDAYCSFSPAFAMISLSEIRDIQSGMTEYQNGNTESIINRIDRETSSNVRTFFSTNPTDALENNNLGDLAILSSEIPISAISIVDCMDEFEMQQIFAKMCGLKEGEFIDYSPDKVKGKPKLSDLINVIECTSNIEELNNTYNRYKNEVMESLAQKKEELNEVLKENLEKRKTELLERKTNILERQYVKKDGISLELGLKDILEELEKKKLKDHLLETDKKIKQDELQYQSDIHGVSHTRRVNFFATLIMNSENVDYQTKKIIEIFVENHDIGRINDVEDKEHGKRSVDLLQKNEDRLDELTDQQKEIALFIIKEHSLSATENINDLNSIAGNSEKKKRYIQKILDICKDADKLDRVRLDPYGINPREGLDVSRLSLSCSKNFENIAYEAFDKILEILDIEHELVDINRKISEIEEVTLLKTEVSQFEIFEEKINEARLVEHTKKKGILNNIVSDRRLSKISRIPKIIKGLFLHKSNEHKR